jgi:predicted dehydrogenase
MAKLRLGIVGVGKHGSRYAKHAAEDLDDVQLVAVCRRDEARGREIADRYGCQYMASAQRLVSRRDIDAVVFVTLPSLLEELVTGAAATGKRILVEKPVAPDPSTGARILRAIESAGVYCMAGHTLRFNGVIARFREMIPSLGRIDSLIFSQRFPAQLTLDWLDDPARSGGGNVLHTGVHCFDLARHLTGLEPVDVWCTMRSVYTRRTEDNFVARMTFQASAALGLVACSRTTRSRNGLIEIAGEHGQLVGDHVLNTLYRLGPEGREDVELGPPRHTVLEALRRFVQDAKTGAAPAVSYRDGLAAVCVAAACYASAAAARPERVTLPPDRV